MDWSQWRPFGRVPEMSPENLAQALENAEVQLLDVRTGVEHRRSRIPGARHLPITQFSEAALSDLELDRGRPVVAICLSAHRSIPAVRKLRAHGYDARQLRGGMLAWWRAGLPCERGRADAGD
ncbi:MULTISPECIES: rhodanese-like domain-containing protein [unclassified Thioalkalivibrio]|uniref:rhodanese-like domain-containing protein n=1 Tax=unclassified Thioalkalivibrio TaxID=2621013 RepID=UPI0003678578|nr:MULTISPECIES: rhodanese-like domain-containing protein [unclassified Thioalkalivibrio]